MIGIVTGIELEAKLCRKTFRELGHDLDVDVHIQSAAGTVAGARAAAKALCEKGVSHLVSFGVCGGLSPDMKSGDLILPESLLMDGHSQHVDSDWHAQLCAVVGDVKTGPIVSVSNAVSTPQGKAELHQSTAAIGVDVESYAVMAVAAEQGIPALAFRTVLDPHNQALPPAALKGVDEQGSTQLLPLLLELLRRPQDLPHLIRLGGQSKKATMRLRQAIMVTSQDSVLMTAKK